MIVGVLTADQRRSSTGGDLVPRILADLASRTGFRPLRPFERTAGDEVQGVLDRAEDVTRAVELLLRDARWSIGLGFGLVDDPLPASTRAGRGPAFVRAREAVTRAKASPSRLRVIGHEPQAGRLETALWLWATLLARRTAGGWAVADLLDSGSSFEEVAVHLGVTQSAVSQRAQTAGVVESRRARDLVTDLAEDLLGATA